MTEHPGPFDVDQMGRTELMKRASDGDMPAVERIIYSLLGTGIFCQRLSLICLTDNEGKTAIDAAREGEHEAIDELLSHEQRRMEWYE